MKILLRATSIAAILLFGANVNAGIVWEINYVGSFDSAFQPVTVDLNDPTTNQPDYVHQIEFRFSMTDLADGEDFSAATFNLNLGAGITESTAAPGWQPADGQFVFARPPFGPATKKGQWTKNADTGQGAAATDLRAILVQVDDAPVANNRQYGEVGRPSTGEPDREGDDLGNPTLVGQLFVNWDGSATDLVLEPIAGNAWATWQNNQSGSGTFQAFIPGFQGATLDFGGQIIVDPDPSVSISDTGTGDQALDYLGSASTGLSLDADGTTFEIANLPGGDLALFLELEGAGDLDDLASKLTGGGVTASTDATNPFLPGANLSIIFAGDFSGTQYVTLNDFPAGATVTGAAVPEPSTFMLTGLALMGMFGCGFRRRRSS